MGKFKINTAMRFFFVVTGSLLWLGIWLTGFGTVHWLLYLPAVFFIFAAVTGICPGLMVSKRLFPDKEASS